MITDYEQIDERVKVYAYGKSLTLSTPMLVEEFEDRLEDWRQGTYVQDAFPMLSAGEREFMLTGVTPEEWEAMWGGFWDDDDEDLEDIEVVLPEAHQEVAHV